ncbi:lytic enzyme [Caenimonas koreensis DSM 17982]|uniref:Lytic enzyme n=1 Tax=Caenimonas koreensis DSM 17982 TaxID=1121255 RepID=A0A844AQV9_9BURK|nr:glycoside hydrolase family 19 protein [Caenimonas koreensis]MRD46690.1 lytic enzyme [Caenimonas koreensis DSM 17982]
MIKVTPANIALLAPSARSSYRAAFLNGQQWLDHYGISANALRTAHFMAQMLHESAGLTIQFENLNYSAQRLPVVWPTRFQPKGPLDPAAYAHNPQKLANTVYARAELGNTAAGDGYKYRGRGLLQLTGKASYQAATAELRKDNPEAPDFVAAPDAVISADWALAIAASEWAAKGCNALADEDSVRKVTRAINGGLIGLAERMEWLKRTKAVWG